jgi:hypothetical protein
VSRVAQSVQCLTTDWTTGVRSPTEAEDVSYNLCVQNGSGAQPAPYTMGTGGSFPGDKARSGRYSYYSPLLVLRLRKSRSYTSSHPNGPLWNVKGQFYLFYRIFIIAQMSNIFVVGFLEAHSSRLPTLLRTGLLILP